jgi:RNA polymerase sigma-70 factor (ECF subfamily)
MNVDAPEMILSLTGRLRPANNLTVFERALAGDLDAFEMLMRSHERQVLGTALRLLGRLEDAQDAAQEVFIRLFRHLKKLRSAEAVGPWLYRVTVNVCNDASQKRRPASDVTELDLASTAPDPETLAGQAQRQRVVARGLQTLAQKERAALVLREVEGLSTREVAEVLGSSEVTVRTQICTARMKLRKFTEHCLKKRV